jgi:hypothetical protein
MTKVEIVVDHVFGKFDVNRSTPDGGQMPVYKRGEIVDVEDDVAEIFLKNGQAIAVVEDEPEKDEGEPKRRGRKPKDESFEGDASE